jgi:oleandomycin transport system ATP-binding protein
MHRDTTDAIQAEGLVKRFGTTTALAGIDLTARTGRVLGLLGPNGAGKTTAVRILATLLTPDAGRATVCGYDVVREAHQVRQLIGLTGQYASVDEGLTGVNNLIMIGRLLGLARAQARSRAHQLLARFELTDAGTRPVKTYSGGMRRRLDLAASLVGQPSVLYLDEPTTGLDPHSRNEVWRMIRDLAGEGVTVLLTTQYLEEADQLANDVMVIDHGVVIAQGTPDELKATTGGKVLEVRPAEPGRLEDAAALVAARAHATPALDAANGLVTTSVAEAGILSAIVRDLEEADITLAEFALRKNTLDEVFLAITGHPAEAANGEGPVNDGPGAVTRETERTPA